MYKMKTNIIILIACLSVCQAGSFWEGVVTAIDTINPESIVRRTILDRGKTLGNALNTINPVSIVQRTIEDDGKTLGNALDTINPVRIVQRTIDDKAETLGRVSLSIGESIPLAGHVIAGVQKIRGDDDAAKRAFYSANSASAAIIGGTVGTLCGPAAVACVPALAMVSQTAMDGLNTHIEGKPMGNVEYFTNFNNKSGVDHAVFGGSLLLDSITAGVAGKTARTMNKASKKLDDIPQVDISNVRPIEVQQMASGNHISVGSNVMGNTGSRADRFTKLLENIKVDSFEYNLLKFARERKDLNEIDTFLEWLDLQHLVKTERHHNVDIDMYNKLIDFDIKNYEHKIDKYELRVYDRDDIDMYSTIEDYVGPISEYKTNYKTYHEDVLNLLCTKMNIDLDDAHKLINYRNVILTDPRSLRFPELQLLKPEQIALIQPKDLINTNVGKTGSEARTNCMRLSVEEVFNVDYHILEKILPVEWGKLNKHTKFKTNSNKWNMASIRKLDQMIEEPFDIENLHPLYGTTLQDTEAVLNELGIDFIKTYFTKRPKDLLADFMEKNKLEKIKGITIVKYPSEEIQHAVVVECVRRPDNSVISILKDFQVDESVPVKISSNVDAAVSSKKFTDFELDYKDCMFSFIFP